MSKNERLIIGIILAVIAILIASDLATDSREGASWWHIGAEAMVAIAAVFGILYIIIISLNRNRNLETALGAANEAANKHQENAQIWRAKAKTYIDGLSKAIASQLDEWGLSVSEREIAFMLLKGLSLREIASIRSTSEKTTRAQAAAIYQKSGLNGRADLAAFFLEDLLW